MIGANGHVVRHLAALAEADRFDVRRVGRDDDLAAALHGPNAAIHLAGTLQPTRGTTYRAANVETVARTIAAAK